jgi:endoglucanase
MLDGVRDYPVKLSVPNRVVYSPHSYGPDVFFMDFYKAATFPANMPDIWTKKFQYIAKEKLGCVLIGETGGRYEPGSLDEKWHEAFTSFVAKDPALRGSVCIWAFNANSGNDTKGLVKDDWTTVDTRKMEVYKRMCPSPTSIKAVMGGGGGIVPTMVPTVVPTVVPPTATPSKPTTIVVSASGSWKENGAQWTRYDVCVKNTSDVVWRHDNTELELRLSEQAKQTVRQSWGCIAHPSGKTIRFPDWLSRLEPGKEWTFGMIVSGSNSVNPTFSLVQKKS